MSQKNRFTATAYNDVQLAGRIAPPIISKNTNKTGANYYYCPRDNMGRRTLSGRADKRSVIMKRSVV